MFVCVYILLLNYLWLHCNLIIRNLLNTIVNGKMFFLVLIAGLNRLIWLGST